MDFKQRLYNARKANIAKIKDQINVMDLAQEMGFHIVRHGALFRMVEHDSCVFYPDKNAYRRFSNEYTLRENQSVYKDVFSFLMEFCDMDFNKAYNHLVAKIDPEKAFVPKAERIEKKQRLTAQQRTMSLQEQLKKGLDPHCKNAIAYLIQVRKIDPSIVFEFVNKRMIMQQTNDYGKKNVVFLGYDENGMLACCEYRACSSTATAKGSFKDCDYDYGWMYEPEVDGSSFCPPHDWSKPCIVTESAIDRMALMSLMKNRQLNPKDYKFSNDVVALFEKSGYDYKKFNWLSLGSVKHLNTILKSIERYGIKEWIIAPDNDETGKGFIQALENRLKDKDVVMYSMLPKAKDWDQDRINLSMPLQERLKQAQRLQSQDNSKTEPNIYKDKQIAI